MSLWGQLGAVLAALVGSGGLYLENTVLLVIAMVLALGSAISWIRWTAPHDHWREFRGKGRSSEP